MATNVFHVPTVSPPQMAILSDMADSILIGKREYQRVWVRVIKDEATGKVISVVTPSEREIAEIEEYIQSKAISAPDQTSGTP